MLRDQSAMTGRSPVEIPAGEDQLIVVYNLDDTGSELLPSVEMAAIGADAGRRARDGWRIVAMTWAPTRHAGAMFGNDGSGYQTKASVVIAYELRH